MKTNYLKFAVLFIVSYSFAAHAGNVVSADDTTDVQILKAINEMKSAGYSKANESSAKVIELVYGDGGPNSSTAFVVIQGPIDAKVFRVANMISGINRITFSGLGEITVNFTRTDFLGVEEKEVQENKSVKIKFTKLADGSLSDTIEITE